MRKELGKIKTVKFGLGGYQGAQFGIHFDLGGDSWGISAGESEWDHEIIKHNERTEWTEQDRTYKLGKICRYVSKLLKQAKVRDITELKGKPVEVTLDGNTLKSWRLLTEVL